MNQQDAASQAAQSGASVSSSPSRLRCLQPRLRVVLAAIAVIAACVAIKAIRGRSEADAQATRSARSPGVPPSKRDPNVRRTSGQTPAATQQPTAQAPQVVAMVNGEEISRQELARECLSVYGKEVLESVMNKHLIMQYCQQQNVSVTKQDVDEEIDRMARKFGLTTEQYLTMLKQERGIKPEQYATDIVWPMLALRRLAKDTIQPSKTELEQAFQSQYGEAIKARIIVLDDGANARKVQAQAAANPDDFGALAKQHSKDPSASMNGLIQPIRRYVGSPEIEKAAFQLQEGQVSPVITLKVSAGNEETAARQYVILKCEGRLPAMNVNRQLVDERLRDSIVDRKLRTAAAEIFERLQNEAKVVNVYNDPQKRKQMPGVAALINDHKVTMRELSEECVQRHGPEVLEGTISRRLLEQALKQQNLTVSQEEIDAEVARAALAMGQKTDDGQPDVKRWLEIVTQEQGLSIDVYLRDSVWPSVALKKLAGDVRVTQDDLQKGFEANYGKRARCRAIVVANQRKAQEIWEQARANPTADFFGKLAEEFSIEPSSKALQGRVPPIQKHGGQPLLEKEAFSLKPGELSSIVQVADKYVILFCEGFTEPTKVTFAEVKQDLFNDIHEKKQRLQMAEVFTSLKDAAQIDNFLAGTTQSPTKKASHQEPARAGSAASVKAAGAAAKTPNSAARQRPAAAKTR